MYKVLLDNGIAVPHHVIVNRDGLNDGKDPPGFIEEVSMLPLSVYALHSVDIFPKVTGHSAAD